MTAPRGQCIVVEDMSTDKISVHVSEQVDPSLLHQNHVNLCLRPQALSLCIRSHICNAFSLSLYAINHKRTAIFLSMWCTLPVCPTSNDLASSIQVITIDKAFLLPQLTQCTSLNVSHSLEQVFGPDNAVHWL